ncbi:bidirectional sugar transporter SWEET17 [Impatiens glandulifera]|uniref:bidirectional sugar transporter SWEET17 n=1 Tax=Impatiens glandulifera TaxID=253017 RepID=UPI001FB1696D|nr:bidirectional sugar transporter SWEET17 [Impatiens glandulifera]
METLSFIIGIIGNILSVLVFLAPIDTFWKIVKNKSTEEFKIFPYVTALLSSCQWVYYGVISPDGLLVATVNGFGIFVESIFILLFLIYAPSRMRMKRAYLVAFLNVGVFATILLVTQLALEEYDRLIVIGCLCVGLNIIMYASPLSAIKTVITTKSVKYMPFYLSFFIFLNSGTWALYGFLQNDFFIWIPNGSGFILGAIQLVLYAIYRNATKERPLAEGLLENGVVDNNLII